MEKRWIISPPITSEFQNAFPEIPPLVLQLLANRGLTTQAAIDEFLNPDYGEDIHDPFLFRDMEKAVARILAAIHHHEKIVIHGDYDADGVSGAAILTSIIRALGGTTDVYIPHRETEGYGMNMNAMRYLAERGANLIITCDCGISNAQEVTYAREKGIDVIITDHHTIPEHLPPAFAIIHPLVSGETYPFHGLAGGGVAFKLAQGLLRRTDVPLEKEATEKWLLDLVTLSTVADMVPLLHENRTLVRYGLIVLQKTRRLGLQKLLLGSMGGKRRTIDTNCVAWYLVPRINAAGRMNHANIAYALLLTNDEAEAERLALELHNANSERQKVTASLVAEARDVLGPSPEDSVLFVKGKDWPLGLVGLVAGKISEEYHRPAIILTERDGDISGSGRSIPAFNMVEALRMIPKYFQKFGGHPMACGFTLRDANDFEPMKEALLALARERLSPDDFLPTIVIDCAVHVSDLTWGLYEDVEKFEPFGEDNPRPRYLLSGVTVESCDVVGNDGKHLRLCVREGEERRKAIGFSFGAMANTIRVGDSIDLIVEVSLNEWNGNLELQLKFVDIHCPHH